MAIAPDRLGLGIRRRFTTEGQDPYDTVTWERRDARITHWATGAVAFEQLGVEVPSGWSINATNILAQKYFRGTLGSAEREWSLKQVADRVVDTITTWGRKDGYFTDDTEALTFSAELKYAIIHQKAAFNSPVWFNIGVKGVPQQASACQPYDAFVNTPDGLIPIGRLVETGAVGTKVYDASGLTKVVAVKANGTKPVLRLHTRSGVTLDVTPDHLVWRASSQDAGQFVPAGELRPGDQLTWHRTETFGQGEITMPALSEAALEMTAHERSDTKRLEIERIEPAGEMPVYDIQTESGEYLSGNIRVHNCFILSVDDSMDSILNWYKEEGTIFKGGSGAGVNLSRIRSSKEGLRGGGTASGPVSFMRGADASAGTIKSGGKTRRAAKMVILDVDHPDIQDFIWCKAIEERKARALRDAGFDMDLDGKDSHSIQYQNANNSVRVTDEFMNAVIDDADWHLRSVTDGAIIDTVRARDLFRELAEAAWQCADPGLQYDTTINRWHTSPNSGRINGSNPCCFVGETSVVTPEGPLTIAEITRRCDSGEYLPAVVSSDGGRPIERAVVKAWVAGYTARLVEVSTSSGAFLRCTPEHRFLTSDGGWVEASELVDGVLLRGTSEVESVVSVTPITLADEVAVYDLEVEDVHNFAVATSGSNGLIVHNSEYMHVDNSACNLASLNLLTFLAPDGTFDVDGFRSTVEVVFTAQEILVGNADYPTERIAENSRRFRQLGIGYANLGALLMAEGLPYDSAEGRAWAAALTALLTGHAYATSARTASRMGPFAGFTENRTPMLDVLRMHRDAAAQIDEEIVPPELLSAAQESWDTAVEIAEEYGVRNAQASVLAPTGCLVGGTLVATDRGLVRLRSLGDTEGPRWQDLDVGVQTDDGPRHATKFYVNGLEPVVSATTSRGHRIQGTPQHRVKVVDEVTGAWEWKRFGDLAEGDVVPLALGQLVGDARDVALPPLPEAYWTGEHHAAVTRQVTPELAELVGYFMGDGSLHSRGLRFCVASGDDDVVERLRDLGKTTFGLEAKVTPKQGYHEVRFDSVRLALWWEACGFAKRLPAPGHTGKGYEAHVPDAILHANDATTYGAFVRGLFEADGDTSAGYPTIESTSVQMVRDTQSLLLALGYPTTFSVRERNGTSGGTAPLAVLRLVDESYNARWRQEIDFISDCKDAGIVTDDAARTGRRDHIPLTRAMIDRLAPDNDRLRRVLLMEHARGAVSRRVAEDLLERTADAELRHLLDFFYDRIASAQLVEEELTYDISVPDNVTYLANGFVSHNTIGLLMDCDTTGVEPDLGLVKTKKLVGGGTMSIVNQTIPRALARLGYGPTQVEEIVAHIDEHKSILGAPHLSAEHLAVFACSMGDNTIHYMGHLKMMGAVQPFISGAISKCVVGDTLVASADGLIRIGGLHGDERPDSFRPEIVEVASLGGPTKTDAFYYGGVRPVRCATLRSGHRVVGTPNHRLLVAGDGGLDWRSLEDIAVDDHVAVQYGDDMWSTLPARFDDFRPSDSSGSQSEVRLPTEMTEDLALLLGAYASEGHTTRSVWTVTITNSVDEVLEAVAAAFERVFGVTARIRRPAERCASVQVHSKTVVEFLEYLRCGERASTKRIPDAVLRSPRSHVLAFLRGLALDACSVADGVSKWAICLDSPGLLDDLQAVLTNLGVIHSRLSSYNREHDKHSDEVYACGIEAQKLLRLVPFLEPDKGAAAGRLLERVFEPHATSDVVPGVTPAALYDLLPHGRPGRSGAGTSVRGRYGFLLDPRTRHVTRRTVERVAAEPGVHLPSWLQTILDDDLHFSPVVSVGDAGEREVFDLSVPATKAFVGNGIVNHNTVNVPEEVTVEDVEQLHIEAWRLGIKAVAIYRDNCKVGQPLSTTKKAGTSEAGQHDAELSEKVAQLEQALAKQTTVVVKQPIRERMPRRRRSSTWGFRVADCEGYVTVGEYEDGRPGEVFIMVAKQGSTLAGIMDAFAISVSLGLQHGVPLATYVKKYTNMRFEPAGMTDDPDLRIAQSLVDYIFRRLAVDYLPYEDRLDLAVLTSAERTQQTLPGVDEAVTPNLSLVGDDPIEVEEDAVAPVQEPALRPVAAPAPAPVESDAPYCFQCGVQMQRAGSCHACPSCGTTSGCS